MLSGKGEGLELEERPSDLAVWGKADPGNRGLTRFQPHEGKENTSELLEIRFSRGEKWAGTAGARCPGQGGLMAEAGSQVREEVGETSVPGWGPGHTVLEEVPFSPRGLMFGGGT